ncbi:DUF6056 family protein [Streptomyces sp. NPDC057638]|uniref:DUF6056 family protein n=1 Tax=Streptomyces sp. NPDC057638 TaxID=3346190 RepID=UPI0036CB2249
MRQPASARGAAPAVRTTTRPPRRTVPLTAALCVLPLALLALACSYAPYVRPSGDDWCFLPHTRDHGIAGMVEKFYGRDNGRIGNGLLVGLYARHGLAGHPWYGPVSVVVVLGLLWALAVAADRRLGRVLPRGGPLLAAAGVTAVFLLASANTYKTLYWPAGSVSHTLAPVFALAAVLPLLWGRPVAAAVTAFTAGVFLGTLSEETTVVALVTLAAALLLARRHTTARARRPLTFWALASTAGLALGTLVLVTSPGSRRRRARFGADGTSLLAPDALGGAFTGYLEVLGRVLLQWQYLGALGVGVLLGLLARQPRPGPPARFPGCAGSVDLAPPGPPARVPGSPAGLAGPPARVPSPPSARRLVGLGAGAVLLSGYLCTLITYPVFGPRVVTAERTWNDYLLLYVLVLLGAGALLGRRLRRHGPGARPAAAVAVALILVTGAGMAVPLAALGTRMEARAALWDRQDATLRAGAARGARSLPYTPTPVGRMLEPFGDSGRKTWPAGCVADWYGLDRVTYRAPS